MQVLDLPETGGTARTQMAQYLAHCHMLRIAVHVWQCQGWRPTTRRAQYVTLVIHLCPTSLVTANIFELGLTAQDARERLKQCQKQVRNPQLPPSKSYPEYMSCFVCAGSSAKSWLRGDCRQVRKGHRLRENKASKPGSQSTKRCKNSDFRRLC